MHKTSAEDPPPGLRQVTPGNLGFSTAQGRSRPRGPVCRNRRTTEVCRAAPGNLMWKARPTPAPKAAGWSVTIRSAHACSRRMERKKGRPAPSLAVAPPRRRVTAVPLLREPSFLRGGRENSPHSGGVPHSWQAPLSPTCSGQWGRVSGTPL